MMMEKKGKDNEKKRKKDTKEKINLRRRKR